MKLDNFIPLEVSLPPGKPPVNHPPPYTSNASRKIYNQDNNYSQANPNIHTGSSNIYNSTSKTPQNVPNMPIPQSLGGQQTNTPGQDYDPDDVPNDEEHSFKKKVDIVVVVIVMHVMVVVIVVKKTVKDVAIV